MRAYGTARRNGAWRDFGARLVLLVLASYGLLYFSYKFLQTWGGTADFFYYYPAYVHPLSLRAAMSPFVLRQISAVATYLVWKAHIFYPNQIAFHDPRIDPHIFFAALFTNWLFLVLAAATAGEIAQEFSDTRDQLLAMLAGLLCLLSFHTQYVVISGDAEGPAWLLLGLGFLAYLRRWRIVMAAVLLLAVVERETLLFAFACIAVLDLVQSRVDKRFKIAVLVWALACFGAYVGLRKLTVGYPLQLQIGGWIAGFHQLRFRTDLLFQGLLTQNMVLVAVAGCTAAKDWRREKGRMLLLLLGVLVCLYLIGILAAIGNNIGRIGGVLTPAFAAVAAAEFVQLARGRHRATELV